MDGSLVGALVMNLRTYGWEFVARLAPPSRWRWVKGRSWESAGGKLATSDWFPPILDSKPSTLLKGIEAEKSFAQDAIFSKKLWKSFGLSSQARRVHWYRRRFVDGEPVHEHLLEGPSTRTGGNGMVSETSLVLNWT